MVMSWKKRGYLLQSIESQAMESQAMESQVMEGHAMEKHAMESQTMESQVMENFIMENFVLGRDSGQVSLITGLFFTLFLAVLLMGHLQLQMLRTSSAYMEDALAASGLASALVDIREYGSTHIVRISDERAAYERYRHCLADNLGLDEAWQCGNKKLISGQVTLENYTVYNVTGRNVEVCRIVGEREERTSGRLGEVCAPNGQVIENTGVYSEISYPVHGLFGLQIMARKGKLVDIVGQE